MSDQLRQLLAKQVELRQELARRLAQNTVSRFFPDEGPYSREFYPKHIEFYAMSAAEKVIGLLGANQVGKSSCAALATRYHMRGDYPHWWPGRKFHRPIRAWVAGDTFETVRDIIQRKLLGNQGEPGSGMFEPELMEQCKLTMRARTNGCADTLMVPHVNGGYSTLTFKAYEQRRVKFQGEVVDLVWLDEEPDDIGIFSECVTRTTTTNGLVMVTFTPLKGLTQLVLKFMPSLGAPTGDGEQRKCMSIIGWDDVPHLTEERKRELIAQFPPHEIQPRTTGMPSIAQGAIYPISEHDVKCDPFDIPPHWPRFFCLDPGWKKTACLWHAWDRESDIIYAYSEHYQGQAVPNIHADAIKARGVWIPGVSDNAWDIKDGSDLISKYRELGLKVRAAKKSDKDARIFELYRRLASGRYRVFKTLQNWFFEYRLYRRDERGNIIKENDHLLNCSEYAVESGVKIATTNQAQIIRFPRVPEMTFGLFGAGR